MLQSHPHVHARFPQLQVNDLCARRGAIHDDVVGLARDLKPAPIDLSGIPRTTEQQAALVAARPECWEYLLLHVDDELVQRYSAEMRRIGTKVRWRKWTGLERRSAQVHFERTLKLNRRRRMPARSVERQWAQQVDRAVELPEGVLLVTCRGVHLEEAVHFLRSVAVGDVPSV